MRAHEILAELAPAKIHTNQNITNLKELVEYMATLGFTVLGGGEFSLVFENPRFGQVVKIYNDECYDSFIEFCKSRPGDPCLPKFRGNSVRLAPNARMIRIERLEDVEYDELAASGFFTLEKIAKSPWVEWEQWDMTPEQEDMLKTLKALYAIKSDKCFMDLGHNVMRRGEQLVIVDPFAPDRNGWFSTHRPKDWTPG